MVAGCRGNTQSAEIERSGQNFIKKQKPKQQNIIQQDAFMVGEAVSFQEGAVLKQSSTQISENYRCCDRIGSQAVLRGHVLPLMPGGGGLMPGGGIPIGAPRPGGIPIGGPIGGRMPGGGPIIPAVGGVRHVTSLLPVTEM